MLMRTTWLLVLLCVPFLIGCEDEDPKKKKKGQAQAPAPAAPLTAPVMEKPIADSPPPTQGSEETANPDGAGDAAVPPPNPAGLAGYQPTADGQPIRLLSEVQGTDAQKAEAGVGKQGQGYGGGIITEPIRSLFVTRDRITLLQIENNMKTYRAIHNNKNPATVDEYIKEILAPSVLTLPELPQNQFFAYDPKTGELVVVTQPQGQSP